MIIFSAASFSSPDSLPEGDTTLHCWTDMTLREVSDLLRANNPDIRTSILSFCVIFVELRSGACRSRLLGRVAPVKPGPDDSKSFEEMRFHPGDYITVGYSRAERVKDE